MRNIENFDKLFYGFVRFSGLGAARLVTWCRQCRVWSPLGIPVLAAQELSSVSPLSPRPAPAAPAGGIVERAGRDTE